MWRLFTFLGLFEPNVFDLGLAWLVLVYLRVIGFILRELLYNFAWFYLLLFFAMQNSSLKRFFDFDILVDLRHESNSWHLWFLLFYQSTSYCFLFRAISLLILLILRLYVLIFFLCSSLHVIYVIKLPLLLHLSQFLLLLEYSFELFTYFTNRLHVVGKMHRRNRFFL